MSDFALLWGNFRRWGLELFQTGAEYLRSSPVSVVEGAKKLLVMTSGIGVIFLPLPDQVMGRLVYKLQEKIYRFLEP